MMLLLAGLTLIFAGAVASVVLHARAIGDGVFRLAVTAGCVLCGVSAVRVVLGVTPAALHFDTSVPGGTWVFGLDALSAAFVFVIVLVGGACAAFGTTYMAQERGHRAVWFTHSIFALLLFALVLVVTAQAIVPFLVAWEVMAIASFLLIVTDHE
ncbi:MAG: hypothetical protein AB1762_13600, partial [Gemmatimonadota bacterium]